MLLDYEHYHRKSSKKKKRGVFIILFLLVLSGGAYFFVTRAVLHVDPFSPFTPPTVKANLDSLWSEFIRAAETFTQADKREIEQKRLLGEILRISGKRLDVEPLKLRTLIYQGYASFYCALYESSYEERLPYLNQAVVSLRKAKLVAVDTIKPQIAYMLGRVYFFKREYYYDLSARYLEQALNMGYKKADVFEYLVLIYEDWGNTEKSITYLEQAQEEKPSDIYLYHLAKDFYKVKRIAEAADITEKLIVSTNDAQLKKESMFLSGEMLFDQGKYAQAERRFREILAIDPDSAEAHFRLALIYEKAGDYAQYRYQLRQTLEKDRGHSGARNRLR